MKRNIIIFVLMLVSVHVSAQYRKNSRDAFLLYSENNYQESINAYRKIAQFQDPNDLFFYAEHLLYGQGTEKNEKEAIKYYKMSANRGYRMAQARLCNLLLPDLDEPCRFDNQKCLYQYSRMFATSLEYSSSTNKEEGDALFCLHLCYKNGWGTSKNQKLAYLWLTYAAYKESTSAERELCDILNFDEDSYDSEELYEFRFHHEWYKAVLPEIDGDNSVEALFFKFYYNIVAYGIASNIETAKELLSNENTSEEGKSLILEILLQYAKTNNLIEEISKYESQLKEYELITNEDHNAWIEKQFVKLMWKIDVKLNSSTTTGNTGSHQWIDLGLPSGTKWATCNIGTTQPTRYGDFFSWGEKQPKKKNEETNYKGDKNLFLLDTQNDPSCISWGNDWVTPGFYDWFELFEYCSWDYDKNTKCIKVKSPNGNEITLPIIPEESCYWTNSKVSPDYVIDTDPEKAFVFTISEERGWKIVGLPILYYGYIRPVIKSR